MVFYVPAPSTSLYCRFLCASPYIQIVSEFLVSYFVMYGETTSTGQPQTKSTVNMIRLLCCGRTAVVPRSTSVCGTLQARLKSLQPQRTIPTTSYGEKQTAISTVPDPSGSGRVDMLTSPVAAARAAVATGACVKSKHMYLIRGSVGLFLPIVTEDQKKKQKSNTGN